MTVRYKFGVPKGLYQLMDDLQQAGVDVDLVADEMLTVGSGVILKGMKQRVPKLTHNLEHKLEVSAVQREGNRHFVLIGLVPGVDADTARYGNVREFGSAKLPAQPYVRPSFDEDGSEAFREMKKIAIARGVA